MQNTPVVPGIVPALPQEIQDIFLTKGVKSSVSKRFIGHDENAEPDPVFMISKGCFYHGVTNSYLSKDIAISLLPPGRMVGFVNFLSRERMPSQSGALVNSEIYSIGHEKLRNIIRQDHKLLGIFSEYQEKCNKSDMYSMLWIMTQPIEERIKMLFAATLLTSGYDFSKNTLNTWQPITIHYTRETIARVAYSSTLSITRYLARWTEENMLKKEQREFYVKPVKLLSAYSWIMERSVPTDSHTV